VGGVFNPDFRIVDDTDIASDADKTSHQYIISFGYAFSKVGVLLRVSSPRHP